MDNRSRVSPLPLHRTDVGSVADVSEAYVASVLRDIFDPEDGGSMCLRNIKYTTHIRIVQRPKSRINVKNGPLFTV
jgi:hypothetical protein